MLNKYIILFFFVVPFFLFLSLKISKYFKLVDFPDHLRKLHVDEVPLAGGVFFGILFLFFFLIYLYFYFFDKFYLNFPKSEINDFFILFFSILSCFVVGIFDDKKNLSPQSKLILIFLIIFFSLNCLSENFVLTKLYFFSNITKQLDTFATLFTAFCFLLLLNASNMADGVNSLASIMFSIWIYIINIFLDQNSYYFFINCILIFSLLLFAIFNFKNKCFLGDSGCFILSVYISFITIYSYNLNLNNDIKILNIESVFLLFLIPGIDMFRIFLKRIYNKKNPFRPDNDHFHHILIRKISISRVIIIYSSLIVLPWFLYYMNVSLLIYIIISTLLIFFFLIYIFKKIL